MSTVSVTTPAQARSRPARRPAAPWGRWYVRRAVGAAMNAAIAKVMAEQTEAMVIDAGCGTMPYRQNFESCGARYLGVDLPGTPGLDAYFEPGGRLPVADGQAAVVLSTQVLEHAEDPAAYLHECARSLRADGHLVVSTHGHWRYHPHPSDYWRWTREGLRRILDEAGFDVVDWRGVLSTGATGMLLMQDAAVGRLWRPLRAPVAAACQAAVAMIDGLSRSEARNRDAAVFVATAVKREGD